jgi:hypothetical protein
VKKRLLTALAFLTLQGLEPTFFHILSGGFEEPRHDLFYADLRKLHSELGLGAVARDVDDLTGAKAHVNRATADAKAALGVGAVEARQVVFGSGSSRGALGPGTCSG